MNAAAIAVITEAQYMGAAALIRLATFGYKGPDAFTFEELCEIQDEAKARAALLDA